MNRQILTILCLLVTNFALAGGNGSGGGDEYTIDFAKVAKQEVYPWLKAHGKSITPPVDAEKFKSAVDPEKLISVDHVYESCQFEVVNEGRPDQYLKAVPLTDKPDPEREACYNGDTKNIYISRSRYPLAMQNSPAKRGLVAHEFFRKMGIEGDKFEVSLQINILSVPVPGPNSYVQDAAQCSETEEAMSSLISSYVDAFKTCYSLKTAGQTGTPGYQGEVTVARHIESIYANDAFICNQVCADTTACNGPTPEGACPP